MKKLLVLTLCVMFVVLAFASSVHATTYNFASFTDGSGYGTKTKVDDNITNIKGEATATEGMCVGPFSKASNAKLTDGIKEKAYVEINPKEFVNGELFEISVALKNNKDEYVSEAVVTSQKINDNEVAVTAGWAPNFKAIVKENGVYTYQWEMFIEDGKTFVKFTLLKDETVIETTGKIDFDTIVTADTKNPIASQSDVSVKYLWFCNVQVAKGINVYAELPKSEEKPPVDDNKEEQKPAVDDNKEQENPSVDDNKEEEKPTVNEELEEKDETPKTGTTDMIVYTSALVAVITLAGIIVVKKHNK